jgi:hypothetical protein
MGRGVVQKLEWLGSRRLRLLFDLNSYYEPEFLRDWHCDHAADEAVSCNLRCQA